MVYLPAFIVCMVFQTPMTSTSDVKSCTHEQCSYVCSWSYISRVLKWEVPKTWLSPGVHVPQRIPFVIECTQLVRIWKAHVDSCWNAMVLHNFKGDKLLHQSLSKHPVGFTMYNDV